MAKVKGKNKAKSVAVSDDEHLSEHERFVSFHFHSVLSHCLS